ncbi:N-acetyltransferase [Nocardioides guangzhouensis]|uniref:N-acetyltransferase n=1 Tax=Nocardioides guangzhouensis TaxID=2497878 RepID=A0A4Q4ZKP5_9ACTN|nr:GNAT family protein [Nocardioides guangzhouensis]RYP88923.1 N-acetyltransferase [Nocardioides guangzhouensis]
MTRTNEHGQPIGAAVDWSPRPRVAPVTLTGRTVTLEPLAERHTDDLADAFLGHPEIWTYSPSGPYDDRTGVAGFVARHVADPDHVPLAVLVDGRALGVECLMRIDEVQGVVEVGGIVLAPSLQRTTASTEAAYLLARHVFDDLGYRRYEWKCDSLNEPSRAAAARLGFAYEGRFRQALVYKGRNRDTDWFSITDGEWPALRTAFEAWLDPSNHGPAGQRLRLEDCRAVQAEQPAGGD